MNRRQALASAASLVASNSVVGWRPLPDYFQPVCAAPSLGAGETSFSLATTTAIAGHLVAVIPGGEDRAAHRSNAVWAVDLKDFYNDSQ